MIGSQRFAKTAHGLRHLGIMHRGLRWLRRRLWAGLLEAIVEFGRFVWSDRASFGPPVASFSLYQVLRTCDPALRGRVILTDQGVPKLTPDSMMVQGLFHHHKRQPWPVFWCELKESHLVTQSLAIVQPHKSLAMESAYGLEHMRSDPAFRYFSLPSTQRLAGNWTSIVSRWVPTRGPCNYTHWLLDALPRLAVLDEFPPDTGIIVPQSLAVWQKESLALMGVLDRCRLTEEENLVVDSYYFSSPTAMLDCYNPYAVNFLRKTFLPKRDTGFRGPRRFVLKRTGKWRPAMNEAEMYRLFEQHGWCVVDTEKLSFAQEVALFNDAEAVAGLLGSGMTNVVFCKSGCSVLQIAPDFLLDGWLDWIVQVVGCNYELAVCRSDYQQAFSIDLQWLEKALHRIA